MPTGLALSSARLEKKSNPLPVSRAHDADACFASTFSERRKVVKDSGVEGSSENQKKCFVKKNLLLD